jgi:glycosyltransferase involved in cell wall biosynthesis
MPSVIALVAGRNPIDEVSGGHSRYVRVHARAALRAGFEPHIFCVSARGGRQETDFGVVHCTPSPFRPFRQLMISGHGPLLAASVARFARERPGPHVIHSFGVWGWVGVAAAHRLRLHGVAAVPMLSSYTTYEAESRGKVAGLHPSHGWRERLRYRAERAWIRLVVERYERRGYLGSALVAVNYESVRRLVLGKYDVAATCRTLPYTCEAAFIREARPPAAPPAVVAGLRAAGTPLIVSIARHEPNKGIPVLLEALARLRASGRSFRACLIGGGPLLAAHRELAGRLGLGDWMAITGVVPDPRPYLQHADAYVLSSLSEQSGSLALIEALQVGLPVVACACDGIVEDVADGRSALLVRPGDPAGLAVALERLLTDSALRRTLGRGARNAFDERFSADAFARALGETYTELARSG